MFKGQLQRGFRVAGRAHASLPPKVELGQWVFYWRARHGEGRWRGPGRIVAIEPSSTSSALPAKLWLSVGNRLLLAAPEQVRPAMDEELLAYDLARIGHVPLHSLRPGSRHWRLTSQPSAQDIGDASELSPVAEADADLDSDGEEETVMDTSAETASKRARIDPDSAVPEEDSILVAEPGLFNDNGETDDGYIYAAYGPAGFPLSSEGLDDDYIHAASRPAGLANEKCTFLHVFGIVHPASRPAGDHAVLNKPNSAPATLASTPWLPSSSARRAFKLRATEVSEGKLSPEERLLFDHAKQK